ncbi:hypothetical protein CK203_018429 [Vitis vinifera]|uniref:Uncharacterized protein n=1 Tax=Vitis vinifera TaxID=29760 RepID=A0A438J5T8_VITVI|nr:hypothetical protein CK203_018429 [Vitis vinifera]
MGYLLLVYLKRWNKEPFGNVSVRKEEAFKLISFWDAKGRETLCLLLRELKEGVVGAFKTLLFEEGGWRPGVEGLSFEVLEELEARRLEGVFSEEEVLGALLS